MRYASGIILIFLFFFAIVSFVSAEEVKITLQITGNPATKSFLKKTILKNLPPACSVPEKYFSNLKNLSKGQEMTLDIPIENKKLKIRIKNVILPPVKPQFLMFSDHPEKITQDGTLLQGGLIKNSPVHLYYYHLNPKNQPNRYIYLKISNPSTKPAQLHLLSSTAGPLKDEMSVGHRLAVDFLQKLTNGNGEIITIPAGNNVILLRHSFPEGKVSSGILQMSLLSGGPVQFTLGVVKQEEKEAFSNILTSTDPHAKGIYEITTFNLPYYYRVCDKEAVIEIGDIAPRNLVAGQSLAGSFGIDYQIQLTLENPDPVARKVKIFFQPRGGHARATFILGKQLIEVPVTQAYQLVYLCQINLKPKEKKTFSLATMPEGGSNYPVQLLLRSH